MEIGRPQRQYEIEPLEEPIPRELPDEERIASPEPEPASPTREPVAGVGGVPRGGAVAACAPAGRGAWGYRAPICGPPRPSGRRSQVARADALAADLAAYGVPIEPLTCSSSLEIRRLFAAEQER